MKVLMLCTVPLWGNGIATCVINYAGGLAAEGLELHILAPEGVPADVASRLQQRQITLHQLPNRKEGTVRYFLALLRHLRSQHYHVVHVHGNSCTMAIELLAAALCGCPLRIAHSHNTSCEHQKAHKLLRPVFELCVNGRVACGQEAGKWLFGKKSFTVVRNGIHLEKFAINADVRAQMRSRLGVDPDTLLLGHVGMFVPAKNHPFLLELASQLQLRGKRNWKLLLIGDGPLAEQTRQEIADAGLQSHIMLTGNVPNVPDYLQAIDLFLLPSLHEGLPFVLVEAQAAGLHALVSNNVCTEVNISGNLRYLSLDEPDCWVQAVENYSLTDRDTVAAAACEKLTEAGYDMTHNARQLAQLYRQFLKGQIT